MNEKVNFGEYYKSLSDDERKALAARIGLHHRSIETNWINGRTAPPLKRLPQIAKATNGRFGVYDLVDYFLSKLSERHGEGMNCKPRKTPYEAEAGCDE